MASVTDVLSTEVPPSATPPRATKRRKEEPAPISATLSSSPPNATPSSSASATPVSSSPPMRKAKVKREKSGNKPKEGKASPSLISNEPTIVIPPPSSPVTVSTVSHAFPLVFGNAVPESALTGAGATRAKRMKLIEELMTSELQHVEALKTVVVDYVQPLRTHLPKDTIKKLFGNIEVILQWNMQFYGRLRARYEESEDMSMDSNVDDHEFLFGDIMVEMLVILRQIYSQYSENYDEAQLTYRELMKSKEFETHIRMTSNGNSKTHLLTLLYLPVGRMIVYDSILKEIVHLTPAEHADREDLMTAQKMIGAATRQANRVVDMRRNLHNVLRIQSMLQNADDIALPHRRYVYEGAVVLEAGPKTFKERVMFLFNDLVLIAKPKRKKYEVEWSWKLTELEVVDTDEYDRTKFQLKDTAGNEVSLASEDKTTWIYHFRATIKNLGATPQELHALRIEDSLPTSGSDTSNTDTDRFSNAKFLTDLIIQWSELKPEDALAELMSTAAQLKVLKAKEGL